MAHFLRLIRLAAYFIVGLLLGACATLACAETIPATDGYPATIYWNAGAGNFSTPDEACISVKSTNPSVVFRYSTINGNSAGCTYEYQGTVYTPGYANKVNVCSAGGSYDNSTGLCAGYSCPSTGGWSLSGSTCTRPDCVAPETRNEDGTCGCPPGKQKIGELCVTVCPTGYHVLTPDNGQCEKDCWGDQRQANNGTCECAKGTKSYFSGNMSQTAAFQGGDDCHNGCTQKAGFFSLPAGVAGVATTGSVSQWITPATSTGAACQGASTTGTVKATLPPPAPTPTPTPEEPADPKNTPTNNADPESCSGSGGVYMTVNGQGKCASPGPDNAADADKLTAGQKTTTTTNADGTTTETTTKQTTVTNPVTGQQSTSSTTTTTTKDANGNVTGTSSSTTNGSGDQGGKNGDGTKGFCQENPQSPICKKSSWTGDCDNEPVCDGDAVQCATAKAVWEHRCVMKWAEKDNELSNGIDKDNLFGDQAKIDAALNKDGTKDFDILATFQAKRQNYLTFAASCNPDLSFDFKGVHYAIDTTALCQIGLVVKVLLHLAAYMALIRILTVKLF